MVIEKEWLSIAEIADRLGLAENTARRYSNLFSHFLRDRKFGRTTKYTTEALEVISRIAALYNQGLSTEEIKRKLQDEMPLVVDVVEEEKQEQIATLSAYELLKQMAEEQKKQREQQDAFNKALLERLDEQQEYIDKSLRERNEQLNKVFEELSAARKEKANKKWWKKIFRI